MTNFYLFPKVPTRFLAGCQTGLVTALLVLFSTAVMAQVSGTVFKDFNANGTKDNTTTYNETGMAGVVVKATKPDGSALTVTYGSGTATGSIGSYTVTGGTVGQIRLEFDLPNDFVFATKGSPGGTTVMFPTTSTQNLAVNVPDDYWDSATNPRYMIPCYVNGTTTGTAAGDAALVSTLYSSTGLNSAYSNENGTQGTGPQPRIDATIANVGTVWGEAYYKSQKHLYVTTFLKRHSGIADGPGYIYNFDYSGATATLTGKFNLQGVAPANGGSAIDLGSVTRTGGTDYTLSSSKSLPNRDIDAFGKVAAMSFGDCDMQDNTSFLWTVNCFQKALIRIDVSGNPTAVPSGVEQYVLSSLPGYPTSTKGVLRPWALKFAAGKGYLGVVDDASTGVAADLKAYVLEFDPNNISNGFTTKLNFDPNTKRVATGVTGLRSLFKPWLNTYSESAVTVSGNDRFLAQPVLSDIEFDENDNMYVSFFDRFGHQMGWDNYLPLAGTNTRVFSFGNGEVLKACKTATGWSIEGTTGCHTGSEFIQDNSGDGFELESSEGASALLKGKNQLLQVSIDPHPQGNSGIDYSKNFGYFELCLHKS